MTAAQPTPEDTLRFNRETLGRDFLRATHTVTRDMILGFSLAIGETNPLFVDEEAAARGPHGDIIAPARLRRFLYPPGRAPRPQPPIRWHHLHGRSVGRAPSPRSSRRHPHLYRPTRRRLPQDRPHRRHGLHSRRAQLPQPARRPRGPRRSLPRPPPVGCILGVGVFSPRAESNSLPRVPRGGL